MPDTPVTAAQFREALGAEWGTYVAAVNIDINGARAFNVGDPVPVSHVANDVVSESQVKKTTTKAGQALATGSTEKG
jgi:hypothetical protein